MVPSMKRSSLPKISPLMVIPWLTQAGALGETGGALAASARVEEGGLSVADCCLLSSGFFHIRHLHGAGSEAAELGPVGQAGGSVRNHDDSTAPQGCKAKRMVLAISCVPLCGKTHFRPAPNPKHRRGGGFGKWPRHRRLWAQPCGAAPQEREYTSAWVAAMKHLFQAAILIGVGLLLGIPACAQRGGGGGSSSPFERIDFDKTVELNARQGVEFVLRPKPAPRE